MVFLGMALMGIGYIIMLVGSIWVLVVAFQESVLWGVCALLIPFAALVFVVMNWEKAGKPFLISLAGIVPLVIGTMIAASGAGG